MTGEGVAKACAGIVYGADGRPLVRGPELVDIS
jgi:hypothetical protein